MAAATVTLTKQANDGGRREGKERMFANTWQDAIVSGRREKEYSGTIIPTLHGVRRLGLCARHVLGAGLWPRPRAAHSAVQRSGVLLAGVHFYGADGGVGAPSKHAVAWFAPVWSLTASAACVQTNPSSWLVFFWSTG